VLLWTELAVQVKAPVEQAPAVLPPVVLAESAQVAVVPLRSVPEVASAEAPMAVC